MDKMRRYVARNTQDHSTRNIHKVRHLVCTEILLKYKKNPADPKRKSGGDINGK